MSRTPKTKLPFIGTTKQLTKPCARFDWQTAVVVISISANTPQSKSEYARIVALVAANGGVFPSAIADLTVNELLLAYYKFATGYYRSEDGKESATAERIKQTLRGMKKLFGSQPAADFGPKALKALCEIWVREGLSRKTVNSRIGNVKRLFRWAVAEELIGPEVRDRLDAVEGLRAGRTERRTTPRLNQRSWVTWKRLSRKYRIRSAPW
jgi:hypothetical protein